MTILEIYEKVILRVPVEQRIFFNFLNDSISEISAKYGKDDNLVYPKNLISEDIYPIPLSRFDDMIPLLSLYHNAIPDNILFLSGQGENFKADFLRKAEEAFLHYWNENARGKRIKTRRKECCRYV